MKKLPDATAMGISAMKLTATRSFLSALLCVYACDDLSFISPASLLKKNNLTSTPNLTVHFLSLPGDILSNLLSSLLWPDLSPLPAPPAPAPTHLPASAQPAPTLNSCFCPSNPATGSREEISLCVAHWEAQAGGLKMSFSTAET